MTLYILTCANKRKGVFDIAVKTQFAKAEFICPDSSETRLRSCTEYLEKSGISVKEGHTYAVMPGLCDVHVHLREPGFSYKETMRTGTLAALHGGYTDVCSMPNLNPVPDCAENLKIQLDIIKKDACVRVHPYAAITVGEKGESLSDMEELCADAAAFSDDGRGVQSAIMMESAMIKAAKLGKIIAAHCEDNSLLEGGYIHKGSYAEKHSHKGISSESEWKQIERDIEIARKTGCKYHVCHISTAESVNLIRKAKAEGVDITCETAPHYLVLTEDNLKEDGRFKMNPPLREEKDRQALIEGIIDGTIDMIATDHAPHSAKEKSLGLEKSLMGVVGLETAFPVLYTYLVKPGIISLEKLAYLMSDSPRKRFGFAKYENEFSLWDLDECFKIDPAEFVSMGKTTPFEGVSVYGKWIYTLVAEKN